MIEVLQRTRVQKTRFGVKLGLLVLGACAISGTAVADEGDSLGALWWQHALSIPTDQNPILDETGASCGLGQYGDIWFLHGSFGGPQIVRNCSVPAGRRFFLPIINWICLPFPGETIKENVELCRESNDLTDTLHLTIDGMSADQLIKRRAQRNPFDVTLPVNNIYGVDPGSYVAVHDGYWAMVPQLEPGEHTIEIFGGISFFGFTADVVYNLTVTEAQFIEF